MSTTGDGDRLVRLRDLVEQAIQGGARLRRGLRGHDRSVRFSVRIVNISSFGQIDCETLTFRTDCCSPRCEQPNRYAVEFAFATDSDKPAEKSAGLIPRRKR